MVLAAGYEVATSEPSTRSSPDVWASRAAAVGAVLVILGAIFQTLSSLL